jgi:putative ABC transport system substrate-binding protein
VRRRDFITLLGGVAAAWPIATRAQQAGDVKHIGFLRIGAPPPSFIVPLQMALKDLGYVEGENFIFDYGLAKRVAELPKLAARARRERLTASQHQCGRQVASGRL